jgi:hypothetical protein
MWDKEIGHKIVVSLFFFFFEAVVQETKSARTPSKMSKLNNEMPKYVAIPNQTISHCFQIHSNEGHTIFSVHPVKGDGNCLYCALSSSSHYSKEMPNFSQKHRFLRDMLHNYAGQKKTLYFLQESGIPWSNQTWMMRLINGLPVLLYQRRGDLLRK